MVLGCGGLATSYPKVYGFIAASARQAQEQSAKEKTRLEVHRVRGKHWAPAESNQESRQPLHFRFQISCALEIKCRWSQVVLVAGRWSLVAGKYWSLVASGTGRWSLVTGRWSLVAGRWSQVVLVAGRWSLVSIGRVRVAIVATGIRLASVTMTSYLQPTERQRDGETERQRDGSTTAEAQAKGM